MQRGREYIGLPIVTANERKPLAIISDLIFDSSGLLKGFLISPLKGLFRREKVIPVSAFSSISTRAAVIADRLLLHTAETDVNGTYLLAKNDGLSGRAIIGEDGDELGLIGDVLMGHQHTLEGFEVSNGVVMDFLDGRQSLRVTGVALEGDHVQLTSDGSMHLQTDGGHDV